MSNEHEATSATRAIFVHPDEAHAVIKGAVDEIGSDGGDNELMTAVRDRASMAITFLGLIQYGDHLGDAVDEEGRIDVAWLMDALEVGGCLAHQNLVTVELDTESGVVTREPAAASVSGVTFLARVLFDNTIKRTYRNGNNK